MKLKEALKVVRKMHEDAIDDLMDSYEGYEEELYLYVYSEDLDDGYLFEFFYKDQYDKKVTDSLYIKYNYCEN
jgi:hypothetical protein